MQSLQKVINNSISLTAVEMDFVLSLFKPVSLAKGEYLLEIGEQCNKVAFVKLGVLRMFHFDDNGEETTHYFPLPNSFVTSHTSLNNQTPSTEGIQAITTTELVVISKENLEMIYQKVPAMQEVGRKAIENIVAEMSKRISILINNSADKRYKAILDNNPILVQTVPLQYLASYLGITPQHLSRIRKKIK